MGDCHVEILEPTEAIDLWATQWPPVNGVLNVGWGGECSLAGTGYTGGNCDATATSTPISLGIIRVADIMTALKVTDGTLPYALQTNTKCSNSYIAPMLGGDGTCAGGMPEGSRIYLDYTDAQINAMNLSPIAKIILRTIDSQHYGMINTDTGGGQDGFGLVMENGETYTALGLPNPYTTTLIPELAAEGISGSALGVSGDVTHITSATLFPGVDFTKLTVAASNQ